MGRDGNADVGSDNGDVSVTDLNGNLKLSLQHSSARISQISSDVTIQGRANDVSVEDVKGTVHLDGDFMESVKLARIAKPVSFKSSRTDMDFSQLTGYLNLDSGDLEANNIIGPFHLRTRSKDIMLNGISNEVRIENENGAVEIHVNKLGGIDVRNSNADIRVFVPERTGFQVNAQAQGDGEIQSDFSQIKIDKSENRTTAAGSVNGGGPRIVLSDEHGSIEIRKGNAVPVPSTPPKTPDNGESPEPTEN
jgi:putative adhesin